MSLRHALSLAIVAVGHAFACHLAARADDQAQLNAHESAVLDRIFANWKARHDRVHSFHFTWDCRTTFRKGEQDPFRGNGRTFRLDRDQQFDEFGMQLLIDGDDRICFIRTPHFKVPSAKPAGSPRIESRSISDGKVASSFFADSSDLGGSTPRPFPSSRGYLIPSRAAEEQAPTPAFQALLLTFRPQFPSLSWQKEQCHVIFENAIVDGVHCVKIQRNVDRGPVWNWEETCWVDPARDDVVVHWVIQSKGRGYVSSRGSIKYKKDASHGWIPSEWNFEHILERRATATLRECKVTDYAINQPSAPNTFAHEFPAGTPVEDKLSNSHYVVQKDGSKRTISSREFNRVWDMSEASRKRERAKP
jgi:hypothetical protein